MTDKNAVVAAGSLLVRTGVSVKNYYEAVHQVQDHKTASVKEADDSKSSADVVVFAASYMSW